jgi:hypothetical protein
MLYVDIPSISEFADLNRERADACVSIYLETTPLTQHADASRIALGNLAKEARHQLEAVGLDKRLLAPLMEHIDDLADDTEFWRHQANSLAVLATPDKLRTYRLANKLSPTVQVSDRFHLKPLLRAITFPNAAFVLALSENGVRVVEVFADLPAQTMKIDTLPKDAASSVGKSTLNDRAPVGRIQGAEGQNVRFRQYARQVDAALRPVLTGRTTPLILAATGRLDAVCRSVNSYPTLLIDSIKASPDRMTDAEIADAARPILDAYFETQIDQLKSLYDARAKQGRATTDISDAARAATYGAIEALLVDMDSVVPGTMDEETGVVTFADGADATSYGIVDEIAGRALASGARVLAVRKHDLPGGGELAAILRFAV